jgi:hypothetical protein
MLENEEKYAKEDGVYARKINENIKKIKNNLGEYARKTKKNKQQYAK